MPEFGQAGARNQPHIARADHRDAHAKTPKCAPVLARKAFAFKAPTLGPAQKIGSVGPMIKIRDLVFEYPTARALDGVSLDVAPEAITALVGPNGAGKTTLLRLMAALDTPYAGSVAIDGLDTQREPREVHRTLGYLPDFFGLYDGLSVRRCLTYAARAHGLVSMDGDAAVTEAAESVGLADRLDQAAGALSRGLRQRLAIAQALVHRPKLSVAG